jgi:hypothetical protein
MKKQDLKNRLVFEQEIVTFTNDEDVFNFSFSHLRGKYRIMKNGVFISLDTTLTRIKMCIKSNKLSEEI